MMNQSVFVMAPASSAMMNIRQNWTRCCCNTDGKLTRKRKKNIHRVTPHFPHSFFPRVE